MDRQPVADEDDDRAVDGLATDRATAVGHLRILSRDAATRASLPGSVVAWHGSSSAPEVTNVDPWQGWALRRPAGCEDATGVRVPC